MSIKIVPVFEPLPPGYHVRHRQHREKGYLKTAWESHLLYNDRCLHTVLGGSKEGNHSRLLDWLRAQSN